ncbi:MAG: hypothetical protein ACI814_004916, partial [Mariniblastus sp.]
QFIAVYKKAASEKSCHHVSAQEDSFFQRLGEEDMLFGGHRLSGCKSWRLSVQRY